MLYARSIEVVTSVNLISIFPFLLLAESLRMNPAVRSLVLLCFLCLMQCSAEAQPVEGMASFYADRFHGRTTSTGETYDKAGFTAASKTYPYGTRLEVTSVAGGESVEVRVNDCGPHHPDRILDLSRAAAAELGLLRSGVAKVRVRVIELGTLGPTCDRSATDPPAPAPEPLGEATPPPPAPPAPTVSRAPAAPAPAPAPAAEPAAETFPDDVMLFGVQVGTFSKAKNATELVERLRAAGFADAWTALVGRMHRVFTGKFYFQDDATDLRDRVRTAGFPGAAVRRVQ